jgi:L-aspartate oxidase
MWRHAGLERDAAGLRKLLDDPHPLARLVARCALFREESRGAHVRADFPRTRPGYDEHHTVVAPGGDAPVLEPWA